jgi:UDP-N-acetylglucosamine--N-acetylmuramyl-(pentapeptide) pyrophosphoryl-undecaprenol N-acetylglucosamine transferase
MLQRQLKVIISTGGTGGHIFPAIAVAQALQRRVSDADILFVGARDKMEMHLVPAAGYEIEGLWISGFQRSLSVDNLSFPFKLISSLSKAGKILKRVKPDIVVGFGGFASGPMLYAATMKHIPTLILEENAYPGVTNRILKNRVDRICLGNKDAGKYFPAQKSVFTGNPIRKKVIEIEGKRDEAIEFFNLKKDATTVLVIGGSQGAASVNQSIAKPLGFFTRPDVQLLWQTGKVSYQNAMELAVDMPENKVRVEEFIDRMDLAYAAADIIISRAGAIAVAELSAIGKPVIFIPLPTAAENHQFKNANALVQKNAAMLVPDSLARRKLLRVLEELIEDKDKQLKLSRNLKDMAIINADEKIVEEILKLIK